MAASCGDDDDAAATPPATSAPLNTTKAARDLVPDLKAQGFAVTEQGPDPAAPAGQDVWLAGLQRSSSTGGGQAQVRLYRLSDAAAARTSFQTFATALKNPPPGFFGQGSASQVDNPSPPVGDQQKGYVTAKADARGNLLWTDVFRFGNVVAIVQLVEAGSSDQMPLRRSIAEGIVAKMR